MFDRVLFVDYCFFGWTRSTEDERLTLFLEVFVPRQRVPRMPLAFSSLGAAAVAGIFMIYGAYRDYLRTQFRRENSLRERLAYMLWQAANPPTPEPHVINKTSSYPTGGNFGDHRFLAL